MRGKFKKIQKIDENSASKIAQKFKKNSKKKEDENSASKIAQKFKKFSKKIFYKMVGKSQ